LNAGASLLAEETAMLRFPIRVTLLLAMAFLAASFFIKGQYEIL
jgi:hypothetical protein